ncbi:hypothetical protein EON65_14605 [archaeon]|nr:MAG: hypothetical protein EON65_14605 [archaeon]
MYFLRGSLPWQGMKAATKRQKYDKILENKVSTTVAMLCKNFPIEFKTYFEHVKGLSFDDRPDYDYLKRLFRELFFRKGYTYDNVYDWEVIAAQGSIPPSHIPHEHEEKEDDEENADGGNKHHVLAGQIADKYNPQDIPMIRDNSRMEDLHTGSHQMSSMLQSQSVSLNQQRSFQFGVTPHHGRLFSMFLFCNLSSVTWRILFAYM